jgi:phosphohistidine phosphatase
MELILWRHAEAEDGIPDMARELTAKGRKQAKQMAAWLKSCMPDETRILVSPAARTQQTASALGMDFTMCDEIAPGATAHDLLKAANWPQSGQNLLIVGHQPTLGEVAALLLAGQDAGWSVKKGAVWWITSRSRAGTNECVLRAVMTPELLQKEKE